MDGILPHVQLNLEVSDTEGSLLPFSPGPVMAEGVTSHYQDQSQQCSTVPNRQPDTSAHQQCPLKEQSGFQIACCHAQHPSGASVQGENVLVVC